MRWVPKPDHLTALKHAWVNDRAGLFLKPGKGKTSITFALTRMLQQAAIIRANLVVAPLRVCYDVWPNEQAKWSDFSEMSVGILHGDRKEQVLAQKHDVYVINPDGLYWLAQALVPLAQWPFDMLTLDESTRFKHTSTLRFKLIQGIAVGCTRRLLLTGTPASERLEDLFGQLKILDGGHRLGRYITHFRLNYMDRERHTRKDGNKFDTWTPQPDALDRVKERVKDLCLYLDNRPGELPDRTDVPVSIPLAPGVKKIYDKLERDFVVKLKDGTIRAVHGGAKNIKLRQVAGGTVYDENGVAIGVHKHKLRALKKIVEIDDCPVIIAVAFKHEVDAIRALFKRDIPYLGDGISPKKSKAIIAEWNAGKLPMILVNPESVAFGHNLQAGGFVVIWFTLTWSLENYDQTNRRVWRSGQQNDVIVYHLLTQGTVDGKVYEVLQEKDATQASLLNALKR